MPTLARCRGISEVSEFPMLVWFACIIGLLLTYIGLALALMRLPVEPEDRELN